MSLTSKTSFQNQAKDLFLLYESGKIEMTEYYNRLSELLIDEQKGIPVGSAQDITERKIHENTIS